MKNLIIAAVLLIPAAAGAQQNLKIGNMEVNPFISVQESYDSNIYLTKQARRSAVITRTSLGFDLVEKIGSRLDLKAGTSIDVLAYSRATNLNDATHHNANLSATARLPKSATLAIDDKYKQTTDQATSETTERSPRIENTAGLTLTAPLRGQFGFAVVLQHVYNNYLQNKNAILDREETLMGADLSYKLQPKTKAFFSYRVGTLNYQLHEVNDATYNNMDLGLAGNIAPKVTGTVAVGMQARDYKNDKGTAKNAITTMGYSAQAVWKPMERSEVILYGKRGNIESSYGDSRFYTSSLIDLTITRQLNKVKAGVGFGYEGVLYPEKTVIASVSGPKRNDENTTLRVTAEYNMQKWLKADAGFTYRNRNSNVLRKINEYNDKVVSFGIKAQF